MSNALCNLGEGCGILCNFARILYLYHVMFTIKTVPTIMAVCAWWILQELHVELKTCAVTVKIQGFIAKPFVTNTKKCPPSIYFFQHGTVVSVNYFCNKILLLLNASLSRKLRLTEHQHKTFIYFSNFDVKNRGLQAL